MKRVLSFASALLVASSIVRATPSSPTPSPPPDFWYVLPGGAPAPDAGTGKLVRGIVVPSSVHPTVRTTPAGSVISWRRPDGTRRSFAVRGMSSFTFEPGPLAGTTYVPFVRGIIFQQPARSCCTCASWQNSVESMEAMSCIVGCIGCGCEGCICSPGLPCPIGPDEAWTLVAHDKSSSMMTFATGGDGEAVTLGGRGDRAVSFRGRRLSTRLGAEGEAVIDDPDSITLPGGVEARVVLEGDKARYAWSSPDATVILEQPRSIAAPSFREGTIDLRAHADASPEAAAQRPEIKPVMDRCSVCGTHPDSDGDVDRMECVPGFSVCYRCISWECFSPGE